MKTTTTRMAGAACVALAAHAAAAAADGYRLVWADEFNADGKLSPKDWTYERGFVRMDWDERRIVLSLDGLTLNTPSIWPKRSTPKAASRTTRSASPSTSC